MLVLQRKKNQAIMIDGKTTITISDIGNDFVKLAIDAPRDIRIIRKELMEAADSNKEAASHIDINKLKNVFNK